MNAIIEKKDSENLGSSVEVLDTIGINLLKSQITTDSEGLIEIPDEKAETWSVGDFVELVKFYDQSAKTANDNLTRLLLAANDRGLYNEVKMQFSHRFGRQTVNQWKTQIQIAGALRMHGLPIRCIEAIRSDFGLKLLKSCLRESKCKSEIALALVQGSASSKFKNLKQKVTGKSILLEDIVYTSHTPDRQFEEFIFKLFEIEKPDFVWHHIGKDKKSEMGIDILGEKSVAEKKWRIGIQVKLYQKTSYIADEDWRDFLAGCTIHRLNEIYLVIHGRLTQKQLNQSQMADITIIHLDQINRLADKHSLPHFELP